MERKKKKGNHLRHLLVKAAGIFVVLLFISVFTFVVMYYSQLKNDIFLFVSNYGYFAIFFLSFLVDFVEQPLSPDVPMVAGIILGANFYACIILASLGSIVGSVISYSLGKKYGEEFLVDSYGQEKYKKWEKIYMKHGRLTMLIAALTPLPYVIFCWIAGIFKLDKFDFLFYGIIARILRFIGVAYLTWFLMSL
jgi:membrane protein YqaA with SNARE-associated domain